jgi:hypothetical protein
MKMHKMLNTVRNASVAMMVLGSGTGTALAQQNNRVFFSSPDFIGYAASTGDAAQNGDALICSRTQDWAQLQGFAAQEAQATGVMKNRANIVLQKNGDMIVRSKEVTLESGAATPGLTQTTIFYADGTVSSGDGGSDGQNKLLATAASDPSKERGNQILNHCHALLGRFNSNPSLFNHPEPPAVANMAKQFQTEPTLR